jgi:hypothetical protein
MNVAFAVRDSMPVLMTILYISLSFRTFFKAIALSVMRTTIEASEDNQINAQLLQRYQKRLQVSQRHLKQVKRRKNHWLTRTRELQATANRYARDIQEGKKELEELRTRYSNVSLITSHLLDI